MTLFSQDFLTLSLLFVIAASLLLLVAMIGLRVIRKLHEQHLARLDVRVRPLVLSIAIADPEELPGLFEQVGALRVFAKQQAVDTAFRMLAEVSGESRRNLAALMEDLGVIKKALHRAGSLDPVRRARAAELLGLTNPSGALKVLSIMANDRNREVRIVAVRGLGRTGISQAVPYIEKALATPDTIPPWLSGSALIELEVPQAFDLALFLENENPVVRQTATTLASLMPNGGTAEILGRCLLTDPDRLVRVMAARALGRLQSRQAIGSLAIAAKSDTNRSVRVAAALALASLPEEWTIGVLESLQDTSMPTAVRRAAMPAPTASPGGGV